MSFLPILAIGGAFILFAGKKKRKRTVTKNGNGKALPPAPDRGTTFEGDGDNRPDLIKAKVGERFSVALTEMSGTGYGWSLAASPPDNSVAHVKTEYDEASRPEGHVGGSGGRHIYIFEGAKPGSGSLVFHLQAPWLEGKEPPSTIVEILTEIS